MRKALIGTVASALVLTMPVAAYAQTSVSCMYMLMRAYHAELDACHAPLNAPREARYQRMKAGLEKFIRANAKNDPEKILSNVDDNVKRAVALLKSCNSDDFKAAQAALDNITTEDHEKLIQGTLSVARDPRVGDCSS